MRWGVVALLVVPMLAGVADAHPATAASGTGGGCGANPNPLNGVVAHVTWNGVDVCSYSSPSSSLGVSFANSADVHYVWSSAPGAGIAIDDARLSMQYFGFALTTRDVFSSTAETPSGSFDMNWTPGVLTYVLEGMYELTASLIAPNGSALWTENFYVTVTAPYVILAALPLVMIVLAIYEVYSLARSGQQAALTRRPEAPPPPAERETTEEGVAPAEETNEPIDRTDAGPPEEKT